MTRRSKWATALLLSGLSIYCLAIWLCPPANPGLVVQPTHRPDEPFGGVGNDVWGVAFSPTGDLIASAGGDCQVRLWNLDGSPHGEPLEGHKAPVLSVAFSPTSGVLASAGGDG